MLQKVETNQLNLFGRLINSTNNYLNRWSKVPQEVHEMRIMQPETGFKIFLHRQERNLLYSVLEKE